MLVGHQKQWQFLKKSAENEKIPHALLFSGEAQLGKKTLALEFIKLLDCEIPEITKRPCQICRSCQDIQKKQHPDLIWIEPLEKEIQISQIRELIWKLSLRPYSAPFKAAVIDRAHFMNQEAQSAFLKTLEEPKGNAILILVTETPELILPTILSRVQKIKFYPVSSAEIENYLKTQKISNPKIKEIARLSMGRPGKAIDFISDPKKLEIRAQKITYLIKILNSPLAFRFQSAKDLSREKNLREILNIWLSYFREVLLSRFGQGSVEMTKTGNFNQYSLLKLKNILKLLQSTNFLISTTNINPRLALEILMLEL